MRSVRWAALWCVVGCGGDPEPGPTTDDAAESGTRAPTTAGNAASSSSAGGMTTSMLDSTGAAPTGFPTPCTETTVDVVEPDHEPNDTPAQATDLCTIDVVGSWTLSAEIGGADTVDYFVFASADGIGVVPFSVDPCWEPTMDFVLYDISDGDLEVFWDGTTGSPGCDEAPGAVPANRVYLLEVAVPDGATVPASTGYGW
ncbi:MAG: hypothetical protein AAF721_12345 [Myxococcota bacterium]